VQVATLLADEFEMPGLVQGPRPLTLSDRGLRAVGRRYAASHLTHTLGQLLAATVFWTGEPRWARQIEATSGQRPAGILAVAEYAAFTHQRALYEVFCDERSDRAAAARIRLGHPAALSSSEYRRWIGPLNSAVAHLGSRPLDPVPHSRGEHLKDSVGTITADILRLWRTMTAGTSYVEVAGAMSQGERAASDLADDVARWMQTPMPKWDLDDPFLAQEDARP